MRIQTALLAVLAASFAVAQSPAPRMPPEVPYVPTPDSVVEGMLKLAAVQSADTVYDLGCGDGRIVITAAKTYKAHGVGVDINPERVTEAKANAQKAGVESLVKFEENDLFNADIRNASVVTLYLLPSVNLRLRPKLLKELKPGTRIVSHSFDMGEWKPDKEELVEGRHLYLWTVPSQPPDFDKKQ